jgi:hypothetical protein
MQFTLPAIALTLIAAVLVVRVRGETLLQHLPSQLSRRAGTSRLLLQERQQPTCGQRAGLLLPEDAETYRFRMNSSITGIQSE